MGRIGAVVSSHDIDVIETGTPKIHARMANHVAWVTLNDPEHHNALDAEMQDGLGAALAAVDAREEARVVVLRGSGTKAFASGANIRGVGTSSGDVEADRRTAQHWWALSRVRKPTIAMIHGWCLGGGLLLAAQADIRICDEVARFSVPAARLGIAYPEDGVESLTRLIGEGRTAELLFAGEQIGADIAARWGLVNHVVASSELHDRVSALAERIATNAPLSVAAAKRTLFEIRKPAAERDRAALAAMARACIQSADLAEGRTAFIEKRPPEFTGH